MSAYPPRDQPKTEKQLGRLVSNYAEASGLGVRRVRQRVSAMAFLGALERVREEDSPTRFLIKGGIACELFNLRGTHTWPPTLTAEPNWPETYRELAAELDFPTKDLDEAITRACKR